jgi:hypothetical protein
MSYSIGFTVATKAIAKERVIAEMDNVVAQQPVHVKDQASAVAAAHAFIDLLADDDTKDIQVIMHGSAGYFWARLQLFTASVDRITARVRV